MINFISTPNIGLKRKLKERFKVYDLDEFRTSKLNNRTETVCENLVVKIKEKYCKLHSVLTYQMENKRIGCIHRDKNSVLNMRKIVTSFLNTGSIPENYKRSTKLNDLNPSSNKIELQDIVHEL